MNPLRAVIWSSGCPSSYPLITEAEIQLDYHAKLDLIHIWGCFDDTALIPCFVLSNHDFSVVLSHRSWN